MKMPGLTQNVKQLNNRRSRNQGPWGRKTLVSIMWPQWQYFVHLCIFIVTEMHLILSYLTFIKTKWRKIKFMIKNDQIDQKKSGQCLENCFWFKFTYPTDVKKQVLLVSCSFNTIPVGGWLAGRPAGQRNLKIRLTQFNFN